MHWFYLLLVCSALSHDYCDAAKILGLSQNIANWTIHVNQSDEIDSIANGTLKYQGWHTTRKAQHAMIISSDRSNTEISKARSHSGNIAYANTEISKVHSHLGKIERHRFKGHSIAQQASAKAVNILIDPNNKQGEHERHDNGHDHHQQEQDLKSIGLPISFILIAFMIFMMTVVYLTNSSDPQVKVYSFKVLSLMLAIFCALMIEKAQAAIIFKGIVAPMRGGHPIDLDEVWCTVATCAWFVSLTFLSKYLHNSPSKVFVWVEGIVTHVVAFGFIASIEVWQGIGGHMLEHQNAGIIVTLFYVAWPPACLVLFFVGHVCMGVVRRRFLGAYSNDSSLLHFSYATSETVTAGSSGGTEDTLKVEAEVSLAVANAAKDGDIEPDRQSDASSDSSLDTKPAAHHEEPWYEIAEECEWEASAIVFGFTFKEAAWACTTVGKAVPHDCALEPENGCRAHLSQHLTVCGIIVALSVLVLVVSRHRDHSKDHRRLSDFIHAIQTHLTYAFAWVIMNETKWLAFYFKEMKLFTSGFEVNNAVFKSAIWQKSMNVMVFWPIYGVVLIGVDKAADAEYLSDKCAHKVIKGMSLAVAVLMESMYAHSIDSTAWNLIQNHFGQEEDEAGVKLVVVEVMFVSAFLCLVIPAWALYIAPLAMNKVPKRSSTLPRASGENVLAELNKSQES